MRFEHVYDKVGNKRYERRAWTGRDKGDFYTYDAIYRLTNVMYGVPGAELESFKNNGTQPTTSDKTTAFNMDGVGNRTSVVDSQNGTTNYSTNNMNEYTIINGVVKANDESGNLIDDGTKTFKWDFANRLSEVYEKSTGNLIVKYKYDARGRRVARISGTTSGQGASSVSPLFDKRGGQPEAGRGVSAITNAKNPQARAARINALQSKIRGLENALAQHLKNNPNGTNTTPAPAPTPTVVPPVSKGKNKLQEFVESQQAGASDNAINNLTQELTQTYELLANELNLTGNCFWFYDGDEIVEQRDDTDTVMSSWINGIQIDERIEIELSGIKYYYHLNTLGTVYALTDSSGAIVERYEYDSYGKATIYDPTLSIVRTYSIAGNFSMFTGRQLDYETGLYYYRARMYDSETGRFLSHDRLGYIDGMGLYTYVRLNPIRHYDPYGNDIMYDRFGNEIQVDCPTPGERMFWNMGGNGPRQFNKPRGTPTKPKKPQPTAPKPPAPEPSTPSVPATPSVPQTPEDIPLPPPLPLPPPEPIEWDDQAMLGLYYHYTQTLRNEADNARDAINDVFGKIELTNETLLFKTDTIPTILNYVASASAVVASLSAEPLTVGAATPGVLSGTAWFVDTMESGGGNPQTYTTNTVNINVLRDAIRERYVSSVNNKSNSDYSAALTKGRVDDDTKKMLMGIYGKMNPNFRTQPELSAYLDKCLKPKATNVIAQEIATNFIKDFVVYEFAHGETEYATFDDGKYIINDGKIQGIDGDVLMTRLQAIAGNNVTAPRIQREMTWWERFKLNRAALQ